MVTPPFWFLFPIHPEKCRSLPEYQPQQPGWTQHQIQTQIRLCILCSKVTKNLNVLSPDAKGPV